MRILYLTGPHGNDAVLAYLRSVEDHVEAWSDTLFSEALDVARGHFDFAVSCNFKHLLSRRALNTLPLAINLHTSFLPWNRGSQPNFWAWRTGTPHGVSIHVITPEVDSGPIYAQKQCHFLRPECETLATTHAYLQEQMAALFIETWPKIKSGELKPVPQEGRGSFHDRASFAAVKDCYLTNGWQTPVLALKQGKA